MKENTSTPALSYFQLSLLSFLRDSHPERASDTSFITARGDAAAEAYSTAVKSGLSHDQAGEIASEILYTGLHFSPFNLLVHILWNEFADDVPADNAREVALRLLPLCKKTLEKYALADDFADSSDYHLLYTKLTGIVQMLLEDGL